MKLHCKISPRITCNPCGNTMKMSLRYHRLLIYDVKELLKWTVWVPLRNAWSPSLGIVAWGPEIAHLTLQGWKGPIRSISVVLFFRMVYFSSSFFHHKSKAYETKN